MLNAPEQLASLNHPRPLSVEKISLFYFRNYETLRLLVNETPVILTGTNGSGKTNLLEAISLLVPGRGLRKASLNDLQNRSGADPWGVAVELRTEFSQLRIGTGRDPQQDNEIDRRLVHIDGRNVRGQNALANHVAMAWITPEMDRILAEGASARRKLLDRLSYSFDPSHSGRISRYEKAMRERLRLLREGNADTFWLKSLEDEMAQSGVAIAATRRHMIRQLRTAIDKTGTAFPRADIYLKGFVEEALEDQPALLVEDTLRTALLRTRPDDTQSGTCSIGPHRSDLRVHHIAKNCPAELCSTGEQKALLIAIMIAYVRTLTISRKMTPLLLLDDIIAHLDDFRREALFEEIRDLGVQAWFTGTDQEPFKPLIPFAQHFIIDQGRWQDS